MVRWIPVDNPDHLVDDGVPRRTRDKETSVTRGTSTGWNELVGEKDFNWIVGNNLRQISRRRGGSLRPFVIFLFPSFLSLFGHLFAILVRLFFFRLLPVPFRLRLRLGFVGLFVCPAGGVKDVKVCTEVCLTSAHTK